MPTPGRPVALAASKSTLKVSPLLDLPEEIRLPALNESFPSGSDYDIIEPMGIILHMKRITVLVCILAASFASADMTKQLTAVAVRRLIQNLGAAAALQQMYNNERSWERLLANIATGQSEWLEIANTLFLVSDAGASEQLELAVGEALEHRPQNVLRISVPALGIGICGGPDVDDHRYDSYEFSMSAIKKRQKMLLTVDAQDLRASRTACIAELEKAKAGIALFYENHATRRHH